jgi:hypothetical protein
VGASAFHTNVGLYETNCVGSNVTVGCELAVGDGVGLLVGDGVGDGVGGKVGKPVGSAVGAEDGSGDGAGDGENVSTETESAVAPPIPPASRRRAAVSRRREHCPETAWVWIAEVNSPLLTFAVIMVVMRHKIEQSSVSYSFGIVSGIEIETVVVS